MNNVVTKKVHVRYLISDEFLVFFLQYSNDHLLPEVVIVVSRSDLFKCLWYVSIDSNSLSNAFNFAISSRDCCRSKNHIKYYLSECTCSVSW